MRSGTELHGGFCRHDALPLGWLLTTLAFQLSGLETQPGSESTCSTCAPGPVPTVLLLNRWQVPGSPAAGRASGPLRFSGAETNVNWEARSLVVASWSL